MSSQDIPLRDTDQDWLDEAILAAVLALQLGNTTALQLQRIMTESRKEIEDLLRFYRGGSPSKMINRIKGIIAKTAKRMEKESDRAVALLVALEARSLGVKQKDVRDTMLNAAIGGRTSKGLIKRYVVDYLSFDLTARIRELTAAGVTGQDLVDGAKRVLDTAERSAATVANSRANAAVSAARRKEAIKQGANLMWVSVLDSRTTVQCASLDGEIWDAKEDHVLPPIHPNCRSQVVIVPKKERPKGYKPFGEWLESQPKKIQDTVLGVSRAEAWRQGALTLRQMVDATRTRPISTKRLREMGRL